MSSSIQGYFDNNPVVGGIIIFIIISLVVIIVALIILFVKKSKNNQKKLKISNQSLINEVITNVEENIEKVNDNFVYFELNLGKKWNLILTQKENEELNEEPTRQDFLNIINNSEQRLILPEGKVWILIDENNNYATSEKIKDKNLFVFKEFVKFMKPLEMSWATSKFA